MDTPRTEAALIAQGAPGSTTRFAEFARTIEQELIEVTEKCDELAEVVEAIEMAMRLPGVTAAEVLDWNSPIRAAIRAALAKYRQPQEEAPELFPGTLDALRDFGKQEAPPSPAEPRGGE